MMKNQTVDVYKEGTQTNWGNTAIVLSVVFFLVQLIAVFLAFYLFDDGEGAGKKAAQTVFLICAAVDGLLLVGGAVVGIYHLGSRQTAKAINDHDRTDSEGDAEKLAVIFNGTAAVTQAQSHSNRTQVAAEKLGLQWMIATQREAQRIAAERKPNGESNDDEFLKQLLGTEPLMLEKDNEL